MNNNAIPEYVRAQLRDYLLFVTRLNQGEAIYSTNELQDKAISIVSRFDEKLTRQLVPEQQRRQIRYALYALTDEIALRFLNRDEKSDWESKPLQVSQFGEYAAGVQLFEEIQTELHKSAPSYWLLSIWRLVFSLGFNGRYLFSNTGKREELIRQLDERLPEISIPEISGTPKLRSINLSSFSIVFWSLALLLLTIAVYLILNKYLAGLVAEIK